jgi:hypothetical protein
MVVCTPYLCMVSIGIYVCHVSPNMYVTYQLIVINDMRFGIVTRVTLSISESIVTSNYSL